MKRTPSVKHFSEFGASELRLEQFCECVLTQKQNAELPLNASEQEKSRQRKRVDRLNSVALF